ncbi:LacI family transcriptional regulator [Thalassobacillus devorans]|uniref:LacI family transcriptional regulator n=1 Tax=Thalassobacillus devorans TaxID=279813 RepID=A0ABQ1NFU9_9BACI|nr:LacI family DNA-binding transcriptional regulator [Thalassobacillus devorans]NIK27206.1 DNA-binding LacI/PurR family transcriptional regulator [Thalassobacillus devorans]GGC75843.1 LacI family transcriptional regulator [Thalassobacillus devorans]
MVSIKDVAKLSGVSVTTVSRVMNNRGYIGKATREKVEDAMRQLNYQPNQIARALLKNQSSLLGVIIPDVSHPLFAELVNWIESYASDKNYKLLVCNSLSDKEKELHYISMLRQNRVDGIVMASHTLDVASYQDTGMPIVSFDRVLSSNIPYIASDNYKGGELATLHLIDRGCKKLLHISGPLEYELLANRRSDAFQLTCIKNGIEGDCVEGAHIKATFEDNWDFIDKNIGIQKLSAYDGVFCSNDIMAYTLYVYADKHNINVPEQLKIIGYDYHSFTRMLRSPALTTISQPIDAIGNSLCSTLIELIENPEAGKNKNVILDVELIQGETT